MDGLMDYTDGRTGMDMEQRKNVMIMDEKRKIEIKILDMLKKL